MRITVNCEARDAEENATLALLFDQMDFAAKHFAVEVNLEVVPRADHADYVLKDGDRLEIVTLVGGG